MAGIVEIQKARKELQGILDKAGEDGVAMDYVVQKAIPIAKIVSTENPRHEPANLFREGIKLIDAKDTNNSIVHMALSDDMEVVGRLVEMVEKFENDTIEDTAPVEDDTPFTFKEGDDEGERRSQSLISLARSIRVIQLQAVLVRKGAKDDEYILAFGQRRLAAICYLHAKSRLDIHNKVKGAKLFPPVITATEAMMTKDEAYEAGLSENLDRKGFTILQEGAVYQEMSKRKNPKTKKPYNLKEIAQKVHNGVKGSYARVRTRHALMMPFVPAEMAADGKTVVKPSRGLTDEDRLNLEMGKLGKTAAIRKALGEQHSKVPATGTPNPDGSPKNKREKPISMADMCKLFDQTSEGNLMRRQAIADCMGKKLEVAVLESEARIKQSEEDELNEGNGKKRKKKGETPTLAAEPEKQPDPPTTETEPAADSQEQEQEELAGAAAE